jgi:hypothetical protein
MDKSEAEQHLFDKKWELWGALIGLLPVLFHILGASIDVRKAKSGVTVNTRNAREKRVGIRT